jgi:acetyl esterase
MHRLNLSCVATVLLAGLLMSAPGDSLAADPPAKPKTPPPTYKVTPTHQDVRYGRYDRNLLDVYRAESDSPTPVLINFHGGAWMVGDKSGFDPTSYLAEGISVVSANYRFIAGTPDAAPYPAPMNDCARAVQFVRSQAKEWNIDPNRVALTGGSAGAVIDMWIAYRDDMARPDSSDPVERLSTRVTCLLPEAGPTTLDPELILKRVGGPKNIHSCLLPFFDIKSLDELKTGEKHRLMEDASPITYVTRDDPPTFLRYPTPIGGTPLPENTNVMFSIHHAEFGAIIKEKLDEAGVENVLQTVGDGKQKDEGMQFLRRHLKPTPPQKKEP